MRTALVRVDVVDVRVNVFRIARIVNHGHFHGDAVNLPFHVHRLGYQGLAVLIHIGHKFAKTPL